MTYLTALLAGIVIAATGQALAQPETPLKELSVTEQFELRCAEDTETDAEFYACVGL